MATKSRTSAGETPARRQYLSIKEQHPEALLLFQMGDFFETFDEDARVLARAAHVTLTSREFGRSGRVPMAGVPVHALRHYVRRLLARGHRVAICEQVSEAGHGLVDRQVTKVLSPGTVAEPELLAAARPNYLAAVAAAPKRRPGWGIAAVEVSTGALRLGEWHGAGSEEAAAAALARLAPAECLLPPRTDLPGRRGPSGRATSPGVQPSRTVVDAAAFDASTGRSELCELLDLRSLAAFDCERLTLALAATGGLLSYLRTTNAALVSAVQAPVRLDRPGHVPLDETTLRHLDVLPTARRRSGADGRGVRSLLEVLDGTVTPMGGRLLRERLLTPLDDSAALNQRLDTVALLVAAPALRGTLRLILGRIGDLERLIVRVQHGTALPRELQSLRAGLLAAAEVQAALTQPDVPVDRQEPGEVSEWAAVRADLTIQSRTDDARCGAAVARHPCREVTTLIGRALLDAPGVPGEDSGTADGLPHVFRPAYSADLDAVVASIEAARTWIAELQAVERERTGIRSLKVGYNRVFGYYIELTRAAQRTHGVPSDYERRQTLTNTERFVTPALKEREAELAAASGRIATLERQLFDDLRRQVAGHAATLRRTARALAVLDVAQALAHVATARGYCRPDLVADKTLEIEAGRHPIVEAALPSGSFVPNDCTLAAEERQIILLTGPNMAGKSTYLRQVGLIVLLAQIGSFVPATKARIGLVDRIFTRIGAHDDLAGGASTFLVEMTETARILHRATDRSLVIVDEIGRGTGSYDGLALARAVVEQLHERTRSRTLFATHLRELTALERMLPRVVNQRFDVVEEAGRLIFPHRVLLGAAGRSYGIEVARLAGLPLETIARATQLLAELEAVSLRPTNGATTESGHAAAPRLWQLPLHGQEDGSDALTGLVDELLAVDVGALTPLAALNVLAAWQERARRLVGAAGSPANGPASRVPSDPSPLQTGHGGESA